MEQISLIIAQPTTFCNIDCSYCYLADRNTKNQMPPEVVEALFRAIARSPLIESPPTLCWHAGEPLTIGLPFYRAASAVAAQVGDGRKLVNFSIQTNGILLTEEWAEFVKEERVSLGISLDGPKDIHDKQRRTRGGHGTYERVMAAVDLLQRCSVDFSVICVLTSASIADADRLYDFFIDHGIRSVGFNIDEIEGSNLTSSAMAVGRKQFRAFIDRLFERWISNPTLLTIREFEGLSKLIFFGDGTRYTKSQSSEPFRIITVGYDGSFATFSPELFGRLVDGRRFSFGNVLRDDFHDILDMPFFAAVAKKIRRGVAMCRASCPHYELCGGGSPSNKWFELGTFEAAETGYCRLVKQEYIQCAVHGFEATLR